MENATVQQELGSLLFERRSQFRSIAPLIVVSVILMFFGVQFLVQLYSNVPLNKKEANEALVFGYGGCLLFVVVGFAAFFRWKTSLRVHRHGISRSTPFGTTDLRFEAIDSLSYRCVRQYAEGVYVGTQFFFHFGFGTKSFYFGVVLKKDSDVELEALRDLISRIIAEDLSYQLAQLGSVLWTSRLRFTNDGLEYRQQENWHLLPYQQIGSCDIDNGNFYLREIDSEFPLMHEDIGAPNFYPGLVVLTERLSAAT